MEVQPEEALAREQLLEELILQQERQAASEAMQKQLDAEEEAQAQREAMTTDGYYLSPSPLEDLSPTRS